MIRKKGLMVKLILVSFSVRPSMFLRHLNEKAFTIYTGVSIVCFIEGTGWNKVKFGRDSDQLCSSRSCQSSLSTCFSFLHFHALLSFANLFICRGVIIQSSC